MNNMLHSLLTFVWWAVAIFGLVVIVFPSIRVIGPNEIGLIMKRFGKRLPGDNPVAFNGEAGYQADLLMPGVRFKLWLFYRVEKYPWVQVPAGEIGVVIAQIGKPLPAGVRSAAYKPEFGNFTNLQAFVQGEGQKGVQRPVVPPGSLLPIHPVAFLIITKKKVYGLPLDPDLQAQMGDERELKCESFNLAPQQLNIVRIHPGAVTQTQSQHEDYQESVGGTGDVVGVVTTLEGKPLSSGYIASRLGGFQDVDRMEKDGKKDPDIIEVLLGDQMALHNNYQDYQAFIDAGGEMGLQHDVLRYGAYNLNPFLVKVEIVPMLVVNQGEVAVIKAYVGLSSEDQSGAEFKYGTLVRPGHRGLWQEPLRTGKYALNPRIYQAEKVPTAILNLNWAKAVSEAHKLDAKLEPITAKSNEGFVFTIDLQVLIHVPDTQAPRVISMVGTMQNLVNEVLQAAVGNHFRDKLGSMSAVTFIQTRAKVQEEAFAHIKAKLEGYNVETPGVYIQDVILPEALVTVLTTRQIATQEIETFKEQKTAQDQRIAMEKAKGTADMQANLAKSEVTVAIQTNNAKAREEEGRGEAAFVQQTGTAQAKVIQAQGLAKAEAYEKQNEALGQSGTVLVNVATVLSDGKVKIMPDILVTGGSGAVEGLAAVLTGFFAGKSGSGKAASPAASSGPASA